MRAKRFGRSSRASTRSDRAIAMKEFAYPERSVKPQRPTLGRPSCGSSRRRCVRRAWPGFWCYTGKEETGVILCYVSRDDHQQILIYDLSSSIQLNVYGGSYIYLWYPRNVWQRRSEHGAAMRTAPLSTQRAPTVFEPTITTAGGREDGDDAGRGSVAGQPSTLASGHAESAGC